MASKLRFACLLCMEVREHLVAKHGNMAQMFTALFGGTSPPVDLTHFDVFTERRALPSVDDTRAKFDAVVITGSPQCALDEREWMKDLERYIVQCSANRVPLIGVCFGHQIIAKALGGQVHRSPHFVMGVERYTVCTPPLPWMRPPAPVFHASASHNDQVLTLPPNCVPFASSERCPYAAYVDAHRVLCYQFHPEFAPEFVAELIETRREILGGVFESSLQSTRERAAEGSLAAQWAVEWVLQGKRAHGSAL